MGAAVVVGNVHETHNQQLLRSHDEEINVLAMSNTGALLASAQVCSKRRQVRFHSPIRGLNAALFNSLPGDVASNRTRALWSWSGS